MKKNPRRFVIGFYGAAVPLWLAEYDPDDVYTSLPYTDKLWQAKRFTEAEATMMLLTSFRSDPTAYVSDDETEVRPHV